MVGLHHAAWNGHKVVCAFLIEKGATVDMKENFGSTPLYMAATKGHVESS